MTQYQISLFQILNKKIIKLLIEKKSALLIWSSLQGFNQSFAWSYLKMFYWIKILQQEYISTFHLPFDPVFVSHNHPLSAGGTPSG